MTPDPKRKRTTAGGPAVVQHPPPQGLPPQNSRTPAAVSAQPPQFAALGGRKQLTVEKYPRAGALPLFLARRGSDCPSPPGTGRCATDGPGTGVKVFRWNPPDFMDRGNGNVTCLRLDSPAGRRGDVGNQSHAGILTHGGDAGNSCGLVIECLGNGHHRSVRCCQPESEIGFRINEEFKHSGHNYPPALGNPSRRRLCRGTDRNASLRPLPLVWSFESQLINSSNAKESRARPAVPARLNRQLLFKSCKSIATEAAGVGSTTVGRTGLSHSSSVAAVGPRMPLQARLHR
jgi:hypothetical protein